MIGVSSGPSGIESLTLTDLLRSPLNPRTWGCSGGSVPSCMETNESRVSWSPCVTMVSSSSDSSSHMSSGSGSSSSQDSSRSSSGSASSSHMSSGSVSQSSSSVDGSVSGSGISSTSNVAVEGSSSSATGGFCHPISRWSVPLEPVSRLSSTRSRSKRTTSRGFPPVLLWIALRSSDLMFHLSLAFLRTRLSLIFCI